MKLSTLVLASLLSSTALAASPVLVSASGDSKVGRAGAFKPAKAGMAVSEQDFIVLAPGAKATVKLADGSMAEFEGKLMVPGRRLVSAKEAGALIKLTQSLQKAAEAVVGSDTVATVPGAGKASNEGDKLGSRSKGMLFVGEEPSGKRTSPAEYAEVSLRANDRFLARERAEDILADAKADSLERRRASLVLAQVYVADDEITKALGMFARAIEPGKSELAGEKSVRTAALVQRAQLHRILGDVAKAKSDLKEATAAYLDTDGTRPLAWSHAQFLIGAIALEEGNTAEAAAAFKKIPSPQDRDVGPNFDSLRELKKTADELVAAAQ